MATQANHHIAAIVGRNIAGGRKAKGKMTQQELASRLGTSISRVSGWENGKHLPRNPQAIADELFGGDITALFRDHDADPVAA